MKNGDKDMVVMKLIIEGEKSGHKLRYVYDLLDKFDELAETTSMARCTAFSAAMAIRLLGQDKIKQSGIIAPEIIG